MEHSINTYRIRYLKNTSLQIAYMQGKDKEEATKGFLEKFTDIQAEKVLSVVNIQETKEEYDVSKIIKIAVSIFIALIVVYGIYLGWNSYNQMNSNEDAKQETINIFSSNKRSDPKSVSGKGLRNSNSYSSEKKDQQPVRLQQFNSKQIADSERQELERLRAEKAKKFVLADETLCSSSDVVVLSCNIKQKILSVCQQKDNKFVYKYGKPHNVELIISSKPLYSHNQFIRANVESRLRFHNKGYDYIVYSNDLFTYDKHPNDGTGAYKSGHGVYVVKSNKLLANLKCNKTYPYMEDIYKLRNSFRHEKYSFLDEKVMSYLKDTGTSASNSTVNTSAKKPSEGSRNIKSDLKDGSMAAFDESIRTLKGHKIQISSVAFSSEGTMIASGGRDGTIKLWDVQNGKLLNTFKGGKDAVQSVAFSPDGTMIASGGDWTIKLWDMQSGTLVRVIEDKGSAINDIAFSPDGTIIVSADEYGNTNLWDVQTGRLLKYLGVNGIHMPINSVAFSPDGTMIATGGGEDSTIRLWDIQSGKQIRAFKGHYYGLAFSPDGNQIASGDGKAIKLWDTQSGRLLNTLKGHKVVARCIAFSPDGTTIVSGGLSDDTIKLWNAKSGRLLDVFEGHRGSVNSVAFSPNGTKIVSGSYDKTIKLWDISSQPAISERQELEQLRAEKAAQEREATPKSMKQSTTIPQNTRADTRTDGSETYYARISQRDHYGARGQKLKDAGTILQQDRANYHKYHKRDREDTGDNRFDIRDNRNKIKRMLARGSTSKKTLDAIRYGTPLVKVKIYNDSIDVTLKSGAPKTRQSKGKPSKCNTVGYIRGISRRGDGFVAVRKGAGTKYRMIDKIYHNGEKVKICDRKGKWKGIIYGDCISGSSRSHSGSCKGGWVYGQYIRTK